MKVIINPTWACQFHCPYCSIHAVGLQKDKTTLSWRCWAWWIRQMPEHSHVEVSGGEPLLYPDFVKLLTMVDALGFSWGLTTNVESERGVAALVDAKVNGCLSLNVSIQPQSSSHSLERARRLRDAGYPVHLNWVDHPDSPVVETGSFPVNRIPYQAWIEGDAVDGIARVCNAGVDHLCCDPAGRVYRCLVDLQLRKEPLGTIDQPLAEIRLQSARLCEHGCSTCYTEKPSDWQVEMRRANHNSASGE